MLHLHSLLRLISWIMIFITSEQSVNVVLENPLDENDYPMYYEPANVGIARSFGASRVLGIILQSLTKLPE